MAHTACLVCLVSTVSGRSKKALEEVPLEVGTKQNLSNLFFFRYLWFVIIGHFYASSTTTGKPIP
jgi:hypothetical protein